MLVDTKVGRLPMSELEIKEERGQGDNDLWIAREWYYKGEMVRRDAWVTLLRGHEIGAQQGEI